MWRRQFDTLGTLDTLAQYVLVARLAAVSLTLAALARQVVPHPQLLFVFGVLIGTNYVALRHWSFAVNRLRIGGKPHYLALDCALSAAVLGIVGTGAPLVLYLVGTVLLAGLLYSRGVTIAAQAVALGAFATVHRTRLGYLPSADDVHTVITLPALILVAGFAGSAVRRLVTTTEQASEEIAHLREQAAVREERLRVARDLHDSVTKNLHALWLLARAFDSALGRGDLSAARSCAATVATTSAGLAAQARGVITGLREDAEERPLAQALEDVVEAAVNGHHLTASVRVAETGPVDPPVSRALLAVAAEAVHNVVKHAVAERVDVELSAVDGVLHLVVTDDGRGFTGRPRPGHYGLVGMRERAGQVGGDVVVDGRPGAGTRVEFRAPAESRSMDLRRDRTVRIVRGDGDRAAG